MAMLLDYGQKTVRIAPLKVVPKSTPIPIKTQIATATTTKPLATALKPTVVKVPTELKASTTPYKQTGVIAPLVPAFNVVQGLYELVHFISPDKPVETTGTYRAVTPVYGTGVKEAVLEASQRKMGLSIVQTPKAQQIIGLARSVSIVKDISAQGYELAPKGTKDYLGIAQTQAQQFAEEINAFRGLQETWSTKQAGYLKTLSEQEKILAQASSEGAVAKGQLNLLTTDYNTLMQKYQELLNKPGDITVEIPKIEFPDIFGGIKDWISKYGLIAVGGVIGLIILLAVIGRRK